MNYRIPKVNSDIDRVIDEALHHIEKQTILRDLMRGVKWPQAFGFGGRGGPGRCGWQGDANGITPLDGPLIPPSRIMERVREYQRLESEPPLNLSNKK